MKDVSDSEMSIWERIALPVSVLGTLLLAWVSAGFLWSFITSSDIQATVPMTLLIVENTPSRSAVKKQATIDIASLHLLGKFELEKKVKPKIEPKVVKKKVKKLKRTALRLVLRGIIRYPGELQRTRVMLVTANGKESVYRVGDSIDDRAKLLEIGQKEIILEVDGERQVLEMIKKTSQRNTASRATSRRSRGRQSNRPRRTPVTKR